MNVMDYPPRLSISMRLRVANKPRRAVQALCGFILLSLAVPLQASPLDAIKPGHWYEVPDSKMADVAPKQKKLGGHVRSVMRAWSGGAYDTHRNRLIVWGGGHRDYAGNELYVFDIHRLRWERLTEPSTNIDKQHRPVYGDGQPRSRHTYNYIEYVPPIDRFISFGISSPYPIGAGDFTDLQAFDFDARRWDTSAGPPVPAQGINGSWAVYDPGTQTVWQHGAGSSRAPLSQYDPLGEQWSEYVRTFVRNSSTPAIDATRRLLVAVGARAGKRQLLVWDLKKPHRDPWTPTTSGDNALEFQIAPGFQYDPDSGRFVGWGGGGEIYVLNPETWAWTKVPPAQGNRAIPGPAQRNGTFGRFRYVPSKDLFILANDTDENVFFYKLPTKASE